MKRRLPGFFPMAPSPARKADAPALLPSNTGAVLHTSSTTRFTRRMLAAGISPRTAGEQIDGAFASSPCSLGIGG